MSQAPDSRYRFLPHSREWSVRYGACAEELGAALGDVLVRCEHIGSTAVPGLAAKSVIDIQLTVTSLADLDLVAPVLVAAGFAARGEFGLAGRRYFTRDVEGWRRDNVHAYAVGHPDLARHRAFAAYLRAHDHARDEYAAVKRRAFDRHPDDLAAYNDEKSAVVLQIERAALAWYASQSDNSLS